MTRPRLVAAGRRAANNFSLSYPTGVWLYSIKERGSDDLLEFEVPASQDRRLGTHQENGFRQLRRRSHGQQFLYRKIFGFRDGTICPRRQSALHDSIGIVIESTRRARLTAGRQNEGDRVGKLPRKVSENCDHDAVSLQFTSAG